MPSIITGAPSALQNAAGNAARIFDVLRQREEEQRKEAEQLKLAERRHGQTDRSLDMQPDRFDYQRERDAVGDMRIEEATDAQKAYGDQLAKYGAENFGVDPSMFEGMDVEGRKGVLNLLEHQREFESARNMSKSMSEYMMEQLGIGAPDPLAPGVQTEEGIQQQEMQQEIDPQIQQLLNMAENAVTVRDHRMVQEAMGGIIAQAKAARVDAQRRMETVAASRAEIDRMKQRGISDRLYGALEYSLEMYERGMGDYKDFRDLKNKVEDAMFDAEQQQVKAVGDMIRSAYTTDEARGKVDLFRESTGQANPSAPGDGGGGGSKQPSYRRLRKQLSEQLGDDFARAEKSVLGGADPKEVAMSLLKAGKIDQQGAATLAWALTQQASQGDE